MEFDSPEQVNHMLNVPGAFSTNPGFIDLFNHSFVCIRHYYFKRLMWQGYRFPSNAFRDLNRLFFMRPSELLAMISAAFFITFIRMFLQKYIINILMNYWGIHNPKSRLKVQESVFKALFYLLMWTFVFICLTRIDGSDLFTHPWRMWDDWKVGTAINPHIKLIYFIEAYMDVIRKDFAVILVHHCVTILLIICSYGVRYHRAGLLVLLCHDLNDVFLEGTKALTNLHSKRYERHIDAGKLVGMALFTVSWIYFRLYKFPLGVMYGTLVVSCYNAYQKNAGLYGPLNTLLVIILLLDLYWFWYITRIIFNRISGRSQRLDDIREYEEAAALTKKTDRKLRNGMTES